MVIPPVGSRAFLGELLMLIPNLFTEFFIPRKLLPNTEKLFRYSVKLFCLYRKTFFFGYQYRKTFSVIYAETINRKTEYTN